MTFFGLKFFANAFILPPSTNLGTNCLPSAKIRGSIRLKAAINSVVHTEDVNLNRPILWLFGLNAIDALLTILWVQSGIANETNHLMDALLSIGVLPFLLFKLGFGLFTAVVLYYGSSFRLAQFGVKACLVVYAFVMCTHAITGIAALGLLA